VITHEVVSPKEDSNQTCNDSPLLDDDAGKRENFSTRIESRLDFVRWLHALESSECLLELSTSPTNRKTLRSSWNARRTSLFALLGDCCFFSVALLAVSLITVKIMFKQNAEANIPQIQTGQHQEGASTNK
jgi:hypothetical protein